jgi:hypothetical protein
MRLRILIYVLSATAVTVLFSTLLMPHTNRSVILQLAKPSKMAEIHHSTVELDLLDGDTIQVHFTSATGKFKLNSSHHLVEKDSSTELASGVMSFVILSDSMIK